MSDAVEHDCEGCALSNRRQFLHEATLRAVGALSLLGLPRAAYALAEGSISFPEITAVAVRGAQRAYEMPAVDGAGVDRDADVIVVRWNSDVMAFDLSCPHQNTALRWDDSEKHFRCPKHKSEYKPDGTFIRGRATRGMDRFAVQRVNDQLVVDTSQRFEQDRQGAQWSAATVRIS